MIIVRGGMVQHVSSNNPYTEVVVVDFDNDYGEEITTHDIGTVVLDDDFASLIDNDKVANDLIKIGYGISN